MTDPTTASIPARRSRAGSLLLAALALVALGVAGWAGWRQWQARQADAQDQLARQRQALDARIDALRLAQRAQAQRLQQAEATNRVLRDELLGLGQRAAVIEDSVSKLADPDRHGAQALRLDQVELLLAIGQQRLQLDGDLAGARRALALAAPLLAGIDDPAYLNLRQTLAQEQAALAAPGADPRTEAFRLLDAAVADLPTVAPAPTASADASRHWVSRLLGRLVHVEPTAVAGLHDPADREAALAALQVEVALARAAIERGDKTALVQATRRIDGWLRRLLVNAPALRTRLQALATLRMHAATATPTLAGSTLAQLRALRSD